MLSTMKRVEAGMMQLKSRMDTDEPNAAGAAITGARVCDPQHVDQPGRIEYDQPL